MNKASRDAIARMVAEQLAEFAEEQRAEREQLAKEQAKQFLQTAAAVKALHESDQSIVKMVMSTAEFIGTATKAPGGLRLASAKGGAALKSPDIAKAMVGPVQEYLRRNLAPLAERLKALEARSNSKALPYRGVWLEGTSAKAGEFYTHRGIWHCNSDTNKRPGSDSDAWTLAVKSGGR